jgi:hypothetical protein
LNGYYAGQWVFQGYLILIGVMWLALLVRARSRWARIGAIFGLVWGVFMTVDIIVQAASGNVSLETQALVNVLICLSWLGCSMCLAIDRLLLSAWDAWLPGLLLLVGALACALALLIGHEYTLLALEQGIATVTLAISGLIWLARPSCWINAPAPTVLFGAIPVILFGLDVASNWYNQANFFLGRVVLYSLHSIPYREATFFFSQVVLLCVLLGSIRLLKCELAN